MKRQILAWILFVSTGWLMAARQPLMYFKLDEGEGTALRNSGSAQAPGEVKNTDYEWGEGRAGGKALYFNNPLVCRTGSNACALVETGSLIDFTLPFSVCLWLKADEGLLPDKQYTIVGNVKGDFGPGWRLLYGWGSLRFAAGDGTNNAQSAVPVSPAEFPHKRGVWNHVGITYDGKKVILYLNGITALEKEMVLHPGNPVLSIGAYTQGYAYGFRGAVSDLKIYDVCLAAAQVLEEAQDIAE